MGRTAASLLLVCLLGPSGSAMEIVAHRGASHDAPENTLAAFRLGFERGADAAECDVFLTADGRIAVIHDRNTARTTGVALEVPETPWAKLSRLDAGAWKDPRFAGERLPLLEQVLALVPAGRRLLIEVKCGPEILPALEQQLASAGLRERAWIISFDLEVVRGAKQRLPGVPVLYLVKAAPRAGGSHGPHDPALVALAKRHGLDGLGLDRRGVDARIVRAAREAGLKVYVWTVDDPDEARRLMGLGIDGLITNRPGWMRAQLGLEIRAP